MKYVSIKLIFRAKPNNLLNFRLPTGEFQQRFPCTIPLGSALNIIKWRKDLIDSLHENKRTKIKTDCTFHTLCGVSMDRRPQNTIQTIIRIASTVVVNTFT